MRKLLAGWFFALLLAIQPALASECANLMEDLFGDWVGRDTAGVSQKLPVYSAPDVASFRAADGKASVIPSGGVHYFWSVDGWDLVEYEVSPVRHRIGYIQSGSLDIRANSIKESGILLQTVQPAWLTDDPFESQDPILPPLPVGQRVTALGQAREDHMYVEMLTENGQRIRGFLPLDALGLPDDPAAIPDGLVGAWLCWNGGAFGGEYLIFHEDGRFEGYGVNRYAAFQADEDAHTVTALPFDGPVLCRGAQGTFALLHRSEGGWWLRLSFARGDTQAYGLRLSGNELLFSSSQSGGGYFRVTNPAVVDLSRVSEVWVDLQNADEPPLGGDR